MFNIWQFCVNVLDTTDEAGTRHLSFANWFVCREVYFRVRWTDLWTSLTVTKAWTSNSHVDTYQAS